MEPVTLPLRRELEIRCSALPRITLCPGSAQPPTIYYLSDSDEARLGTAVHDVLAAWVLQGESEKLFLDAKAREHQVDHEELSRLVWSAWGMWRADLEQYFRFPMVERYLEKEVAGLKLTGHIDVLATPAEEVRILDWKTGWADSFDYWPQMQGYCWLALQEHPQVNAAWACVCWARSGAVERQRWTREELDGWFLELLKSLQPNYRPGEHCGYCPRTNECEARLQQMTTNAVLFLGTEFDQPPAIPLTGEKLGQVYHVKRMLEKACDLAGDMLKAEVIKRGGRVRINNDLELTVTEQVRDTIDGKAIAYLQTLYGPEVFDCATVHKSDLQELVRSGAPRGQKTEAAKKVMDDLHSMGLVESKSFTKLEVKPVSKQIGESTNGDSNSEQKQPSTATPFPGGSADPLGAGA